MQLQDYRTRVAKVTLEDMAVQLGLSKTSKGWLSEIERGTKPASLHLALKIERWTKGKVLAASLNSKAAA